MLGRIAKVPNWMFSTLPGQVRRQGWAPVASYYARRLGMSTHGARKVVRKIKIAAKPISYVQRRAGLPGATLTIPQDKGWLRVPDSYVDTTALVAHCDAMFRKHEAEIRNESRPPYGFAIRIRPGKDGPVIESTDDLKPILDFCAQPKIFDMVAQYIGERPVISVLSLVFTDVNDGKMGPQKFHRDMNEESQVHMVVPIWPIDHDTGPFTLLPADESAKVIKAINHDGGRIEDEDMLKHTSPNNLVELTGPPGTIYFANPYKCIHFGARSRVKPRLMLIVNFSSLFEIEADVSVYRATNRADIRTSDERVKSLLNV